LVASCYVMRSWRCWNGTGWLRLLPLLSLVAAELDETSFLQKELRILKSIQEPCQDSCVPAVWVVSAGRSGSTTVLEMLNQIPGYDIMGENQNMWGSLFNLFEKRETMYARYHSNSEYMTFRQSLKRNMSELRCAYQLRVLGEINSDSEAKVVGFKEIRWDFRRSLDDLKLLMEVFPCSKALLSYRRNVKAEVQSREDSLGSFPDSNFRRDNQAMAKFHEEMPERTFRIAVEDFSVDLFNEMLHFLNQDSCRYNSVLHDNGDAGYTRDWSHNRHSDIIDCNQSKK